MKEYDVKICETLEKVVTVEATSLTDAKHIAEGNWRSGDYILDASDFTGVTFQTVNQPNKEYER